MINLVSSWFAIDGGREKLYKQKLVGSKLLNLANNKQRSLTQFKAWLWHETTIWVKIKHKSNVLVPSIIRLWPTWFPAWNLEKPNLSPEKQVFLCLLSSDSKYVEVIG